MTRVEVKRAGPGLPSGGYGCTRPAALIGVVWIVLGSLALSRWDSLNGFTRFGAILFVVLGIVCTLPMLGLWTLKWWVKRFTTRLVTRLQTAGQEGTLRNQDLYAGDLQFRPAEDSDLTGAARELFEQTSDALLQVGCVLIGDVVNVKPDQAGDVAGVQRLLISCDGRSWLVVRRSTDNGLAIDAVSEFLDGTFCCTSNSSQYSRQTWPAQLQMDIAQREIQPAELLQRHDASLQTLTSSEVIAFATLAEVLASQQRKYAMTKGFQKMIGS